MKPFDCDMCGLKAKSQDAIVRWHFEKETKKVNTFQIVHNFEPCNDRKENEFFNRELTVEYVFKYIPEFMSYISRLNTSEKEFKKFIDRIEKDRSYIRRFNVDKNEVKKLIVRLEGLG